MRYPSVTRRAIFSLAAVLLALVVGALFALAQDDQTYVVQQGDTFDGIAQQYNISLISLMMANGNPHPRDVHPGDTLIIPGDAPPYGAFPPLSVPFGVTPEEGQGGGIPQAQAGEQLYVIQPRDVLDLIAAAYNVQLQCLIERNVFWRPNYIFPGQVLVIPANCPPYDGLSFVPTINPVGQMLGASAGGAAPIQDFVPTQETFGQGGGQAAPEQGAQSQQATPTPTLPPLIQPTARPQQPAQTQEAIG